MPFNLSFDQFKSDPTKAILYLALAAIIYLYIDNKMVHQETKKYLQTELTKKEKKIEVLENRIEDLYVMMGQIKAKKHE
jgi:hypothetical protein